MNCKETVVELEDRLKRMMMSKEYPNNLTEWDISNVFTKFKKENNIE